MPDVLHGPSLRRTSVSTRAMLAVSRKRSQSLPPSLSRIGSVGCAEPTAGSATNASQCRSSVHLLCFCASRVVRLYFAYIVAFLGLLLLRSVIALCKFLSNVASAFKRGYDPKDCLHPKCCLCEEENRPLHAVVHTAFVDGKYYCRAHRYLRWVGARAPASRVRKKAEC